ncbi:MAG: cystathionine gamma-synthase, partial [Methylocella sp.]
MIFIRIGLAASLALCTLLAVPVAAQEKDKQSATVWTIPDINALPDDARGRLVRHGRDLLTMTYAYIGPHAPDRDTRFAGNNLACSNCHLEAGTKKFGLPIYGLASDFPRYSARTGAD